MNVIFVGLIGFVAGSVVTYFKYSPLKAEVAKLKAVIVSHAESLEKALAGAEATVKSDVSKVLADLKKIKL